MAKSDTRHLDSTKLTTPGGVNFTVMNGYPIINLSDDGSTATEQYAMKSTDANKFAAESFPPPVIINGLGFRPPRRQMPGTSFTTQSIEFKPFNDDLTWDPIGTFARFGLDDDSFHPYCLATIEYAVTLQDADDGEPPDPKDPLTFLTRTITAGGQWLSVSPEKNTLQEGDVDGKSCEPEVGMRSINGLNVLVLNGVPSGATPRGLVDGDNGDEGNGPYEVHTNSQTGNEICVDRDLNQVDMAFCNTGASGADDEIVDNTDLELPILIPIHTVEYTITWEMFLNPNFDGIFALLGRVNRDSHPLFFGAKRETVLFTGVSASQNFVWQGGAARAQPWKVEFHFSQRIVRDCGRVYGWNHVYAPKKGRWVRVMRASGLPLHTSFSLKSFFGG